MVLSIGTRRRAGRIAFGLPAACLLGWSGFVLTGANAALPARELVPQSPAADGQPKTVVVRTSSEGGQQIECEIVGGPEDVLWQTDMPPMFMLEQLPPDAIVLMESSGDAQNEDHHVFVAARHGDGADPTLDEFFANHPTADANADGAVTRTERDAYLVALAMSDAAAVLAQFPKADRNADGKLDVTEASLLVIAPMFVDRPAWLHADAAPGGVAHAMVRVARPDGAAGAAPEHDVLVMLDPAAAAQANGAAAHASAGGHKVFVRKVGDAAGTGEARVIVRTNDGAAADAGEHKVVVLNPGELGEEKVVKTPDGKEIRITGIQKNADGSVTGCADNMQIRMRHAGWTPADGEAGGMFNIKLPAPATEWLLSSIDATPTAVEVAGYVPVVESAPLTLFLQLNPKADANGDGVLTLAERDAFVEAHMTQARARVLKQHPDADANGDGLLTNDEMKEFFRNLAQAHKAAAGQQTMQVHVVAPDGGTTDDAIEVEIIKDDE